MDFPQIHSCLQLNSENDILKKKVHRLKREKRVIEKKLKEIEEKNWVANLLREHVTTRDVYVQTEPNRSASSSGYLQRKKEPQKTAEVSEVEKTNKLLSMHSQLMKRYEKEVKTNITHVETISSLNFRIIELERLYKEKEDEVKQLKADKTKIEKETVRSRSSNKGQGREKSEEKSKEGELNKFQKRCKKLEEQNKKLKDELTGLDPGFFEEVEDIKYALRQSAVLNKEYEGTLRKLCLQYALPYPHPEKVLDKT